MASPNQTQSSALPKILATTNDQLTTGHLTTERSEGNVEESHSRSSSRASPLGFTRRTPLEPNADFSLAEFVNPPNVVLRTCDKIPSINHIFPLEDDEELDEEVRRITENIAEATEEKNQVKREGLGQKFERKQMRLNYPKTQWVTDPPRVKAIPRPGIQEVTFGTSAGDPNNKMSLRLKSPATPKDEGSLWEKIGTLGRKKKLGEVKEMVEEGRRAIESPTISSHPQQLDMTPEEYNIDEGKEIFFVDSKNFDNGKLKDLMKILINWINDELAGQRILVKNLLEDLYDGQILQMLLEKLLKEPLQGTEVVQTTEGQLKKLGVVIEAANKKLRNPHWATQKWKAEHIHSKSLVAILYFLVALIRHFNGPRAQLPENVRIDHVIVKKKQGKLETQRVVEDVTQTFGDVFESEKDAFDILMEHAAQKIDVVKSNLLGFVNSHLKRINLEVTELETQLHDGVYFILLLGLLEGYFVPLSDFYLTPKDKEQKVWNVALLFELIQDAGMKRPKALPEDIVNLDLKATLRVLYNLFSKYKNTP